MPLALYFAYGILYINSLFYTGFHTLFMHINLKNKNPEGTTNRNNDNNWRE